MDICVSPVVCVDPVDQGCVDGVAVTTIVTDVTGCAPGASVTTVVTVPCGDPSLVINDGNPYTCGPGQLVKVEVINCCGLVRWVPDNSNIVYTNENDNPSFFQTLDTLPHLVQWECCL